MKKTIMTLGMASAMMMPFSACEQAKHENPLLMESQLPFGAPDFDKIEDTDYLPAFEAAIAENRQNIKAIVECPDSATFENTILALEESDRLLDRVSRTFFALTEADKTRMKEINLRISDLQQQWGDALQAATNDAVVWVDKKEDLAGLSETDIAQCKKDADSRGGKAPYAIVIVNTTQQPILASLDNRELRKRVFEASIHRADGTGKHNTFAIAAEIAKLRAEQAELMGYENYASYSLENTMANYASYSLENTMAKTTDNVDAFLKNLIKAYRPKADAETKAIEDYARKTEGADFKLEPYDRFYYSAKMKKELLDISDDEVKPYFTVDSVLKNGVFYAANRVYGISFKERTDIPVYHPDMKVFEVIDKDGKSLALFYGDYFRRPSKRGGAWMDGFQKQSRQRDHLPIVYNVCNSAKAPEGQPSLITWDEVTTMFHEFGHALHGILSNCQYNSLSGTSVARDFVEMPSQFNESFASIPEVFDHYARHWETGEPMPAELKERMLKSINFQSAYSLGENLAATCLDLAWHMLPSKDIPTAEQAAQFAASL